MATETLNINAIDSAFSDPNGTVTDIDEAVASADGNSYGTTTENDTADFGLTPTALTDGDTINSVTITVRAQKGGTAGNERFQVDLLIGGVVQGSQQSTGNLTTSFANYTGINDAGWNSDWTQAQLNGMQVRLTAIQAGMGGTQVTDLDCIDVIIDYTGGVTHTATAAQTMPTPSQSATGAHVQEHAATVAQTMPTPSQAASGTSIQNFVYFDGTNDWLGSLNPGALSNNKVALINIWLKPDSGDDVADDAYLINSSNDYVLVRIVASAVTGRYNIRVKFREDGTGVTLLDVSSNDDWIIGGQANHLLLAVDLATGTYVGRGNDAAISWGTPGAGPTDGIIDWNRGVYSMGSDVSGLSKLPGGLQESYLTNEFLDITSSANYRKFITADGKPEILGIDGSIPTGTQPAIYCHNPYSNFEVNSGSLGDFTVNGALTDEGTLPQLVTTHTATVVQTMPTPTQGATAEHPFIASAAQTAPTPSQAATGAEEFQAAAAQTVPTPSQSASATLEMTGTVSQTAPTPSQDATGFMHPDAAAAQIMPTPLQSAAASEIFVGAAAQTVPTPTQSATGAHIDGHTATVAQTMPTPSQLATGIHTAVAGGITAGTLGLMGVGI